MKTKKKEANSTIKYVVPKLMSLGYNMECTEFDTSLKSTGRLRGDIWLKDLNENIIGLVELKDVSCVIGDKDWKDAMRQGKEKSKLTGINYYVVSNCKDYTRYYNAFNDEEIAINGTVITDFVSKNFCLKIIAQISENNSDVYEKKNINYFTEKEFNLSLVTLQNVYRSSAIENNDRIDPTISFIVLKYISEKESEQRTLPQVIKLWDDFEEKNIKSSVLTLTRQLWNDPEFSENIYSDFKSLINFPDKMNEECYLSIYKELDKYNFHGGALFDVFGAVYEKYADKAAKKEFGEFYTRRHITKFLCDIVFANETKDTLYGKKICDPACGTGGFLTEAFKIINSKNISNDDNFNRYLKNKMFYGYDQSSKSVARTKLNMFLVGDGHTNINNIKDSLGDWNESIQWIEKNFDFILSNPPMGKYKGDANLDNYTFTNRKVLEKLFVEKMIYALKEEGIMGIVLNDGPLENNSDTEFREKLFEYMDILVCISLPKYSFAPYTKEKTYLLIMKKKPIKIDEITGEEKRISQYNSILHVIIDYDGFSNNDKRYATKYHDDLPEALNAIKFYLNNINCLPIEKLKSVVERKVNDNELNEGLYGYKRLIIEKKEMVENNYIILSERYLRNNKMKPSVSLDEMIKKLDKLNFNIRNVVNEID